MPAASGRELRPSQKSSLRRICERVRCLQPYAKETARLQKEVLRILLLQKKRVGPEISRQAEQYLRRLRIRLRDKMGRQPGDALPATNQLQLQSKSRLFGTGGRGVTGP